jgi:hypothetical protein
MFIGKKGESVSPSASSADAKTGRLGEWLVARGLISQEAISDILDCQRHWGCRFGEVLVAWGAVTAMEMAETLAGALGLAFVDLMADPVEAGLCQAEHIDLYLHRLFLPWRKMGAATIVACADPDAHTRQIIARLSCADPGFNRRGVGEPGDVVGFPALALAGRRPAAGRLAFHSAGDFAHQPCSGQWRFNWDYRSCPRETRMAEIVALCRYRRPLLASDVGGCL